MTVRPSARAGRESADRRLARAGGARPATTRSRGELDAFVRRTTRLRAIPDLPGVRLHVADDVMAVCGLAGIFLDQPDPPLPFWAFPWAGGLALARYLVEHPDVVSGRRVIDVATGSGLCAIVAARSGAAAVRAVDVDPLSEAAVAANARVNGVRIAFSMGDPLDDLAPPCDVILAGDVCYEAPMASRMVDWLRDAATGGVLVLIGDPGRRYLPPDLDCLSSYDVRTSLELEDADLKRGGVYTFRGAARREP